MPSYTRSGLRYDDNMSYNENHIFLTSLKYDKKNQLIIVIIGGMYRASYTYQGKVHNYEISIQNVKQLREIQNVDLDVDLEVYIKAFIRNEGDFINCIVDLCQQNII